MSVKASACGSGVRYILLQKTRGVTSEGAHHEEFLSDPQHHSLHEVASSFSRGAPIVLSKYDLAVEAAAAGAGAGAVDPARSRLEKKCTVCFCDDFACSW